LIKAVLRVTDTSHTYPIVAATKSWELAILFPW
jgi:hypothetical protein